MSSEKKVHKAEVSKGDVRYGAIEKDGKVRFSRGGDAIGTAKWDHDHEQFMESNAILPDDVYAGLERQIREGIKADYFD